MKKNYITPLLHVSALQQPMILAASEPKVNDGKYSDTSQGTLSLDLDMDVDEEE